MEVRGDRLEAILAGINVNVGCDSSQELFQEKFGTSKSHFNGSSAPL
jgi:hypothetical protein